MCFKSFLVSWCKIHIDDFTAMASDKRKVSLQSLSNLNKFKLSLYIQISFRCFQLLRSPIPNF